MRRLVSTIAILVGLAVVWAGGWYALAAYVEGRADAAIAEMAENGVEIDCRDRAIGGFPLALRVDCAATTVTERSEDARTRLAGVKAGVSVLAPLTATISMTAPVEIESPALAGPVALRFDAASLDIGIRMNGPRDYGFDATNLVAEFTLPDAPKQAIATETAEGSLAPSANAGSDVALDFTDLVVAIGPVRFPAFSGSLRTELSVPPRALLSGEASRHAPLSIRAAEIRLESGGARLDIEGDITIGREGVIDGIVVLRVAGAEALPAFISALPIDWQPIGNALAGGLIAFGSATTIDGRPASELKLEIVRGETVVGGFPIGLPPVPL